MNIDKYHNPDNNVINRFDNTNTKLHDLRTYDKSRDPNRNSHHNSKLILFETYKTNKDLLHHLHTQFYQYVPLHDLYNNYRLLYP
jgi:hypothetical protein